MSSLGSPDPCASTARSNPVDDLRCRLSRRARQGFDEPLLPEGPAVSSFFGHPVRVEDQRVAGGEPDLLVGEPGVVEHTQEGTGSLDPLERAVRAEDHGRGMARHADPGHHLFPLRPEASGDRGAELLVGRLPADGVFTVASTRAGARSRIAAARIV